MNYLTVNQAVEKYGLTPRQIYYAIATNRIKAHKIADMYFVRPSEIKKLLK